MHHMAKLGNTDNKTNETETSSRHLTNPVSIVFCRFVCSLSVCFGAASSLAGAAGARERNGRRFAPPSAAGGVSRRLQALRAGMGRVPHPLRLSIVCHVPSQICALVISPTASLNAATPGAGPFATGRAPPVNSVMVARDEALKQRQEELKIRPEKEESRLVANWPCLVGQIVQIT